MKLKGTIIFLFIVILIVLSALVLVPKFFPINNTSSTESILDSSDNIHIYTFEEMIQESDNAIVGTVIKADIDEEGILYTITVSWKDVYKGRNYSTMGYAYVKGAQTLEINKTYLFIGDTVGEKYHYTEPFENAPWVFAVNDDKTLTHISNGDANLVSDLNNLDLTHIKTICDSKVSSK